jgi:cellulose synthase/poly-beta-1,6-N-acetylglucosamine synthase-like glycosyltransferase
VTPASSPPFMSVIVPAHRSTAMLEKTMPALLASDLPRAAWELIIVDDASGDDTPLTAARYADTVVRLPGTPRGPAYARNRGFEVSRGEVVVFVDSDVRIHRGTLRKIATLFSKDRELSAAFGSYDDKPTDPGLVSQYRNLMHHYVHQCNAGEAYTFWAGVGAIRRSAFADAGGFDEWHYQRPQIEDIELGRRLRRLGHRILLRPDVQGTHLKRWTLWNMLKTDFQSRGVPWMWLLLKEGSKEGANTLNLKFVERLCTALVGLALLSMAAMVVTRSTIPLAVAAVAAGSMLLLNRRFYHFLRARRGLLFALAVMPLHFGYYVSNGLSVFWGWLVHLLLGEPLPKVDAAALAQIGLETWPPVPKRPEKSIWSNSD